MNTSICNPEKFKHVKTRRDRQINPFPVEKSILSADSVYIEPCSFIYVIYNIKKVKLYRYITRKRVHVDELSDTQCSAYTHTRLWIFHEKKNRNAAVFSAAGGTYATME